MNKLMTVWLCCIFFVCGIGLACMILDVRKIEERVQLETQINEYRQRCIDWSNYVYRMENDNDQRTANINK